MKSSPTKKLMVRYSGEKIIDDGAIDMEFLTDIMSDIKSAGFEIRLGSRQMPMLLPRHIYVF